MAGDPAPSNPAPPHAAKARGAARRLLRDWVAPQWRLLGLGVVLSLVTAAAGSSYAGALHVSGELVKARDATVIWLAPLLFIGLGVLRSLSLFGQTVMTNRLALAIMRDLQAAMYAKLMGSDFSRLQGEATGALISRFTNDITMLRMSLVRAANNLTRDVFMIVFGIAWMFWIDWALALFVLVLLPLAGQPVLKIGKAIRKRADAVQAQAGDMTGFLDESLSGARAVKTFGRETYAEQRAKTRFEERFALLMSMTRQRAKIEPIMEVAGMAALAGVFALLGWRALRGESGIEDLLGIVGAVLVVSPAARALGSLSGVIQEGLSVLTRVFDLLDETPRITEREGAVALEIDQGAIRFEAVEFGYSAEASAVTDINLEAAPGETVALVGPSGSGKTTLINLIPRLYDPRKGRIVIDCQDVADVTLDSLRAAMALVSQDVVLFDDTVRANIAFGRLDAEGADIEAAAKAADAHDFITALPEGYDTRVGPKGASLSGGQRQRIAIARAVLKDAPILLLDEATSALDAGSEARVQAALDRLREGRTTIVVAHRLATVRAADRIYVMKDGRIVETGAHDALMANGGLYADLCRLQLQD